MSTTDTTDETEAGPCQLAERALWGRIRRGAEGGAVATLVLTAYRLPVIRSLPPTAEFWSKFVSGDGPGQIPLWNPIPMRNHPDIDIPGYLLGRDQSERNW